MTDNFKMLLRYVFTLLIGLGVGKGWFTIEQGNQIVTVALEVAAIIVAMLPAGYAWLKVDNTPKVP